MSQRTYMVTQQLIANNIAFISAAAWDGFEKRGRGVLLIDGGADKDLKIIGNPLAYMAEKDLLASGDEALASRKIIEMLNAYDPQTEVVVIIKWRGEVGGYRFKTPVAPPVVHQEVNSPPPAEA